MNRVLFVCTGNTCRSPMAEAILKSNNIPGLEVKSAGVYASNGQDASLHSKKVLEEHGIELDHSSSTLTESLVDWATIILTMTVNHKQAVINIFPNAVEKTFTLKEFALQDLESDILDPYGGSIEIYRETFKELKELVEQTARQLLK